MRRHHVFLFLHKVSFFMTKSLYVGNLPWSATEDDVRDLFAPYGEVTSVKLVSDRETGRARGFGFVEMASEGVQAAVEALDNFSFSGNAEANRTAVGTTDMGLTAAIFNNESANFSNVTFEVTDGYMEITPVEDEVVVTIEGNNDSAV